MSKYYVTSGTLRLVIQADDQRQAALWAVHRAMQQLIPVFDDDEFTPREKRRLALRRGFQLLADQVQVSQQGFQQTGQALDTFDLISEWAKLMIALSRMESAQRFESDAYEPVAVVG